MQECKIFLSKLKDKGMFLDLLSDLQTIFHLLINSKKKYFIY